MKDLIEKVQNILKENIIKYTLLKKSHHPLQANIYLFITSNKKYIVKDFSSSFLSRLAGKFLIKREVYFYEKLAGKEYILPLLGKNDYFFIIPFVKTINIKKLPEREIKKIKEKVLFFFDELHQMGITNGDVRIKNFLYDGENLFIIDWTTAIDWNIGVKKFFPFIKKLLIKQDIMRIHKTFSKFIKDHNVKFPLWYRCTKLIRKKLYKPIKKRFLKDERHRKNL